MYLLIAFYEFLAPSMAVSRATRCRRAIILSTCALAAILRCEVPIRILYEVHNSTLRIEPYTVHRAFKFAIPKATVTTLVLWTLILNTLDNVLCSLWTRMTSPTRTGSKCPLAPPRTPAPPATAPGLDDWLPATLFRYACLVHCDATT